jgi:hypothetical protein
LKHTELIAIGILFVLLLVGLRAPIAAALVTAVGAISAVVVMPAALVLLGRRIEAFSFDAPAPLSRAWSRLVDEGSRVARRPVLAGFFATLVLAVLAVPAFALSSGPQTITQLPGNAKARIAFDEVSGVMGPGMATPYDLIVVAHNEVMIATANVGTTMRTIIHATASGSKLTIPVPTPVVATIKVVLVTLKLNVAAKDSGTKALITAGQCSAHKFVVKSHFVYVDGSTFNTTDSSACS